MRKSFVLVLALVAALVALAAASAASAASIATGAGSETGFGGGKHLIQFELSAHSGPQGDHGQVRFQVNEPTAPLDVSYRVDCLNVFAMPANGAAWISGTVTRVSPQPNAYAIAPGDRLFSYAVDGGNPSGTVPVDEFAEFIDFGVDCHLLTPFGSSPNVTQGNVNISPG
jgi:hypothetical protein